jgi:hypothetical protein
MCPEPVGYVPLSLLFRPFLVPCTPRRDYLASGLLRYLWSVPVKYLGGSRRGDACYVARPHEGTILARALKRQDQGRGESVRAYEVRV